MAGRGFPGRGRAASLNLNRRGFINRVSDLIRSCDDRQIGRMVVGDPSFLRADLSAARSGEESVEQGESRVTCAPRSVSNSSIRAASY